MLQIAQTMPPNSQTVFSNRMATIWNDQILKLFSCHLVGFEWAYLHCWNVQQKWLRSWIQNVIVDNGKNQKAKRALYKLTQYGTAKQFTKFFDFLIQCLVNSRWLHSCQSIHIDTSQLKIVKMVQFLPLTLLNECVTMRNEFQSIFYLPSEHYVENSTSS